MSQSATRGPAGRFGPARLRQLGEWLFLAAVVAGGAALAWFNDDLDNRQRVAGWSFLGLTLAYLARRGWVRLFGPVLFYDLVRNARRTRTHVMRGAYLLLLALFLWGFVSPKLNDLTYKSPETTQKQVAEVAGWFFATFMGVQFCLAVLLTPTYVAPAIAEEKERKTLEYLLATDLDSREIVLGKLVARLGYLGLLLLAGLPILSAVQFLGGVSPELLLAGFAATAVTVAGLAGVCMLASVYARRSRDAILLTYLTVATYVALCLLGDALVYATPVANRTVVWDGITLATCIQLLQAGNPIHALSHLFAAPGGPQGAIASVLLPYVAFHVALLLATATLAVARLRPVALRESAGAKKASVLWVRAERPVTDRPMIWKEKNFFSGMRLRVWGLLLVSVLVLLSYLPVVWTFFEPYGPAYGRNLGQAMNVYVRTVGTLVACVALLGVAVRGSVAVRVERDKDTLDALLTSPLTTREILAGKWVGCLWGMRWPAAWLLSIYGLGVLTGGLSILAVPLLVGVMIVYSGTLAMVGLWYSVICRTTVRATAATVFTTLGLSVGHWFLLLCCIPFGSGPGGDGPLIKLQAGFTPPVVLGGFLSFAPDDIYFPGNSHQDEFVTYSIVGTVAWVVVGVFAWATTYGHFEESTNRAEVLLPDGVAGGAAAPPAPPAA